MSVCYNIGQRRPTNAVPTSEAIPVGGLLTQRLTGLTLFLAGAALLLFSTACGEKKEAPKPMPPEVLVADVVQQDVPIYQQWVATLNGPVNADITPKVQGYLLRQNYQNGYFVKKGQLLFELDPRPVSGRASIRPRRRWHVAQANLDKCTADVHRDTPLAAQNAIPQKQLDTDTANQAAAKAQVVANKAALENAELNLGWTKVYSPIDGIAGVSNSQVGDLVGTTTKMTTVSQVNPIWAYFNISESDYPANRAEDHEGHHAASAPVVSSSVKVEFIQANDEPYPLKGNIIYVNRQVRHADRHHPAGGAVSQSRCAASSRRLRTGPHSDQATIKNALLVPQAAVIEVQSDVPGARAQRPRTRRCFVRSRWASASARTGSSPRD